MVDCCAYTDCIDPSVWFGTSPAANKKHNTHGEYLDTLTAAAEVHNTNKESTGESDTEW